MTFAESPGTESFENIQTFVRSCIGGHMLGTAVRYFAQKAKPVELKTPPEPTKTITRAIFDIVKEHGPITLSDTWERLKVASPRGLTCKRHMKVVLGWMKKRQKLRLICKQAGRQKYYYYTTWFTKSNIPEKPINGTSQPKFP